MEETAAVVGVVDGLSGAADDISLSAAVPAIESTASGAVAIDGVVDDVVVAVPMTEAEMLTDYLEKQAIAQLTELMR